MTMPYDIQDEGWVHHSSLRPTYDSNASVKPFNFSIPEKFQQQRGELAIPTI